MESEPQPQAGSMSFTESSREFNGAGGNVETRMQDGACHSSGEAATADLMLAKDSLPASHNSGEKEQPEQQQQQQKNLHHQQAEQNFSHAKAPEGPISQEEVVGEVVRNDAQVRSLPTTADDKRELEVDASVSCGTQSTLNPQRPQPQPGDDISSENRPPSPAGWTATTTPSTNVASSHPVVIKKKGRFQFIQEVPPTTVATVAVVRAPVPVSTSAAVTTCVPPSTLHPVVQESALACNRGDSATPASDTINSCSQQSQTYAAIQPSFYQPYITTAIQQQQQQQQQQPGSMSIGYDSVQQAQAFGNGSIVSSQSQDNLVRQQPGDFDPNCSPARQARISEACAANGQFHNANAAPCLSTQQQMQMQHQQEEPPTPPPPPQQLSMEAAHNVLIQQTTPDIVGPPPWRVDGPATQQITTGCDFHAQKTTQKGRFKVISEVLPNEGQNVATLPAHKEESSAPSVSRSNSMTLEKKGRFQIIHDASAIAKQEATLTLNAASSKSSTEETRDHVPAAPDGPHVSPLNVRGRFRVMQHPPVTSDKNVILTERTSHGRTASESAAVPVRASNPAPALKTKGRFTVMPEPSSDTTLKQSGTAVKNAARNQLVPPSDGANTSEHPHKQQSTTSTPAARSVSQPSSLHAPQTCDGSGAPVVKKKGRFVVTNVKEPGFTTVNVASMQAQAAAIPVSTRTIEQQHTPGHPQGASSSSSNVWHDHVVTGDPPMIAVSSSAHPLHQQQFSFTASVSTEQDQECAGSVSFRQPVFAMHGTGTNSMSNTYTESATEEQTRDSPNSKQGKPNAEQRTVSAPTAMQNDSASTGQSALGKVFYFLDQMKSEVGEADRTIRSMQTELKYLRERNGELMLKLRDSERKLMEEKMYRENAEAKVRLLRRKLRGMKGAAAADIDVINDDEEHDSHPNQNQSSLNTAGAPSEHSSDYSAIKAESDSPERMEGKSAEIGYGMNGTADQTSDGLVTGGINYPTNDKQTAAPMQLTIQEPSNISGRQRAPVPQTGQTLGKSTNRVTAAENSASSSTSGFIVGGAPSNVISAASRSITRPENTVPMSTMQPPGQSLVVATASSDRTNSDDGRKRHVQKHLSSQSLPPVTNLHPPSLIDSRRKGSSIDPTLQIGFNGGVSDLTGSKKEVRIEAESPQSSDTPAKMIPEYKVTVPTLVHPANSALFTQQIPIVSDFDPLRRLQQPTSHLQASGDEIAADGGRWGQHMLLQDPTPVPIVHFGVLPQHISAQDTLSSFSSPSATPGHSRSNSLRNESLKLGANHFHDLLWAEHNEASLMPISQSCTAPQPLQSQTYCSTNGSISQSIGSSAQIAGSSTAAPSKACKKDPFADLVMRPVPTQNGNSQRTYPPPAAA